MKKQNKKTKANLNILDGGETFMVNKYLFDDSNGEIDSEKDEEEDDDDEENEDEEEEEEEPEAQTKMTTDHDEIRKWAEERDGRPTAVKNKRGRMGHVQIDFTDLSKDKTLIPVTWDEFFAKFDDDDLVFVYQELTDEGDKSTFNKLVGKEEISSESSKILKDLI